MSVALSVIQPWAWLIVSGYKPVENRSWYTDYRGRLAIHASKNPKDAMREYDEVRSFIEDEQVPVELPAFDDLPLGAIVGSVTLRDCVRRHDSPWFFGPWGFVFTEPHLLVEPIPMRGNRGLWNFEEAL